MDDIAPERFEAMVADALDHTAFGQLAQVQPGAEMLALAADDHHMDVGWQVREETADLRDQPVRGRGGGAGAQDRGA